MLDNLYISIILEYKRDSFSMAIKGVNAMSKYLDQPHRTEKEALEDIHKNEIKHLRMITDKMIKLLEKSDKAKLRD